MIRKNNKDKKFWENLSLFQYKVYKVVQNIPLGQTRSYKWVAEKAGNIKACRAVGLVLSKNTRTDLVPCHRVIMSDGSLGGYVKGRIQKRKILKQESNRFLKNK